MSPARLAVTLFGNSDELLLAAVLLKLFWFGRASVPFDETLFTEPGLVEARDSWSPVTTKVDLLT